MTIEEQTTENVENEVEEVVQTETTQTPEEYFVELGHKKLKVDSKDDKDSVLAYLASLKKEAKKAKELEESSLSAKKKLQLLENEKQSWDSSVNVRIDDAVSAATQKYHDKLISLEIKSHLNSVDDFIGGDKTIDDATKLIVSSHKLSLDDSGNVVTEEGEALKDLVKKFIDERPVYKKAPEQPGFSRKGNSTINTHSQHEKSKQSKRDIYANAIKGAISESGKK